MKKLVSLLLSAALLTALCVPAAAEQEPAAAGTADQRLAGVTAKVKDALGIGEEYGEFYGQLRENAIAPVWELFWSGGPDGTRLEVEATEDGKVVSCCIYEEYDSPGYSGGFSAAFPAVSRAEAQTAAESFLAKILDPALETAVFHETGSTSLDSQYHRFGGTIRLNGVDSPLTFSLSVRASDGTVTRFFRDWLEQDTTGGVPSATPAAAQSAAGDLLKGKLALRLEYVLDPDTKRASLRYLPQTTDEFYVDAQTGELINLTELQAELQREDSGDGAFNTASAPAGAAADGEAALSPAELEGIAKMEGVLSKEELDQKVRAVAALGLDQYALAEAGYALNRETGEVTAQLSYTRRDGDNVWRRTVSCDGKTGALAAVSSYIPYLENRTASVTLDQAQQTASAFLAGLWGGEFAETELYDSEAWTGENWSSSHSFQYAQKVNGYFCPGNSLRISVDVTDGSISSLERTWTGDAVFDSAEGVLSEAAAMDAWFGHYDVALAYRRTPVKLDPNAGGAAPLMEMGYSYFYVLKLTYALEEPEGWAEGVDAKTGEVLYRDVGGGAAPLAYSDLEGHWVKTAAETLAQYNVGWSGETFQPEKEVSQLDLIALLASVDGYRYDPESGEPDDLYRRAYSMGILTQADRQDGKILTRGETVKLLLDCAGYGEVAALQDIFTCSFADKDAIPSGMMGYAALAQGMKILNASGSFADGRTVTRAEAATMLYNFMNR